MSHRARPCFILLSCCFALVDAWTVGVGRSVGGYAGGLGVGKSLKVQWLRLLFQVHFSRPLTIDYECLHQGDVAKTNKQ